MARSSRGKRARQAAQVQRANDALFGSATDPLASSQQSQPSPTVSSSPKSTPSRLSPVPEENEEEIEGAPCYATRENAIQTLLSQVVSSLTSSSRSQGS